MHKGLILWKKVKIKVVSTIVNLFASQTNYDIENTVLLLGSARSGTTFLMENLNSNNDFRVIFEPFNATYTDEWKLFGARHYIDPERVNKSEKRAIHSILQGKIKNKWVDQYNRKISSEKRLIKCVRANLLIDYFESKYPELKMVYIYRDPFKVIASRISLNFDSNDVFSILKHDNFLSKYYSDINVETLKSQLNNPASCHAALWCLENRFILDEKNQRNIIALQYESILGKRILLGDDGIFESTAKQKPSATSSLHKSYQLSKSEFKNIDKILSLFGMNKENEIM